MNSHAVPGDTIEIVKPHFLSVSKYQEGDRFTVTQSNSQGTVTGVEEADGVFILNEEYVVVSSNNKYTLDIELQENLQFLVDTLTQVNSPPKDDFVELTMEEIEEMVGKKVKIVKGDG